MLQLIRLIRIFQDQRVQEAMTSDLELDLVRLAVAFYACSYIVVRNKSAIQFSLRRKKAPQHRALAVKEKGARYIHEASFRRQISMNCLMSETS